MAPLRPPPDWSIVEEHLEEAAFCWARRERALDAPNFNLCEVADGIEERLAGHLDGLVVGAVPVAKGLLFPALDAAQEDRCAVAAWALLAAEDADHLDLILEAATTTPATIGPIARAMRLSAHPRLADRLRPLWMSDEPVVRLMVFEVVAGRDPSWAEGVIVDALASEDPSLLAAASRALRHHPAADARYAWHLDRLLAHQAAHVREEAMVTAVARGLPSAWPACRAAARASSGTHVPAGLLATSPRREDRAHFEDLLGEAATRPAAVWALGFIGDVASADAAVGLLGDSRVGPLAAEAFAAITGLTVEGRYQAPAAGDDEVVGLDDPPPQVLPTDLLPRPNPQTISRWWSQNRPRFASGSRFIAGQPRSTEQLKRALLDLPTWRLEVAKAELAATSGTPAVATHGWARDVTRRLSAVESSSHCAVEAADERRRRRG